MLRLKKGILETIFTSTGSALLILTDSIRSGSYKKIETYLAHK